MEKLSNFFNETYYLHLSNLIKEVYPAFQKNKFYKDVIFELEKYELMQRLRNTALLFHKYLTNDYRKNVEILKEVVKNEPPHFRNLIFPDYVQLFGIDDYEFSLDALTYFTQFSSSEFAVRHFILKDEKRTIQEMEKWSKSDNFHIRRLASEGSRPRLPWSFKLHSIDKNPKITSKILENLKEDKELYVKKSVANHLNDFSKDYPNFVLETLKTWDLNNLDSLWIAKHATRTIVKQGNKDALKLFGFTNEVKIRVENFITNKDKIKLGDTLNFSFDIISDSDSSQNLVIDYIIHYNKKNEKHTTKVFKLKNYNLNPSENLKVTKNQTFKDFTTRKHFLGEHFIEIQINGNSYGKYSFFLV